MLYNLRPSTKSYILFAFLVVGLVTLTAFMAGSLRSDVSVSGSDCQNIALKFENYSTKFEDEFDLKGAKLVAFQDINNNREDEILLRTAVADRASTNFSRTEAVALAEGDFNYLMTIDNFGITGNKKGVAGIHLKLPGVTPIYYELSVESTAENEYALYIRSGEEGKLSTRAKTLLKNDPTRLRLRIERKGSELRFYYNDLREQLDTDPTPPLRIESLFTGVADQTETELLSDFDQVFTLKSVSTRGAKFGFFVKKYSGVMNKEFGTYFDNLHVFGCAHPVASEVTRQDVLAIGYNPRGAGTNIAEKYYSAYLGGRTPIQYEDDIFARTLQTVNSLNENVVYRVKKRINISTFPDLGNLGLNMDTFARCVSGHPENDAEFCDRIKNRTNYKDLIEANGICQIIKEAGIDEIWLVGAPYLINGDYFSIGEGQKGYENYFSIPGCGKRIAGVTVLYENGNLGGHVHSWAKAQEEAIKHLSRNWSTADRRKYIENVFFFDQRNKITGTPRCNRADFAFNTSVRHKFDSKASAKHNCAYLTKFPVVGTSADVKSNASCTEWGCSLDAGRTFWLKFLPKQEGRHTLTSKFGKQMNIQKNWWRYLTNMDLTVATANSGL